MWWFRLDLRLGWNGCRRSQFLLPDLVFANRSMWILHLARQQYFGTPWPPVGLRCGSVGRLRVLKMKFASELLQVLRSSNGIAWCLAVCLNRLVLPGAGTMWHRSLSSAMQSALMSGTISREYWLRFWSSVRAWCWELFQPRQLRVWWSNSSHSQLQTLP